MVCPVCKVNDAVFDEYYGWLPCLSCRKRQKTLRKPTKQVEFTSSDIKLQRRAYLKDFLPMHNRGQLSKEWLDTYGTKKAKQRGFSDTEIKKAKKTWTSETYYK